MLSDAQYDLEHLPEILPLPWMYVLAVEIGDWHNAALACVSIIRWGGDREEWSGRLREVRRARFRRSIPGWGDGGRLWSVGDHVLPAPEERSAAG